jgi:hypothetical protein
MYHRAHGAHREMIMENSVLAAFSVVNSGSLKKGDET